MDLRRLRYFAALAEELNVRRAAQYLGISQSALTKQIGALEADLCLDLFVRDRQRLVGLTQAGNQYLGDTRRILAQLEEAERSAREIAGGGTGRLRLGVCEDAATSTLARIIAAYHGRYPAVGLDVYELPSLARALHENTIDLALVLPPFAADAGVATAPLWHEDWAVALPCRHALAQREKLACSDLAREPLILLHAEWGSGSHDQICAAFRAAAIAPRIAARALRRSTMLMLASAGMGVAFVPASMPLAADSDLIACPFAARQATVSAAYRAGASPAAAMLFIRTAEELVGKPT